jgi:predicted transcriptional regulator of viral defense system
LVDVIQDRELGSGAWRLLLYAIERMDFNSLKVYLIPEETIKELGIGRKTFYRWLGFLLRKGYIERMAKHTYRIRPYTAVKGNMEQTLKTEPDF